MRKAIAMLLAMLLVMPFAFADITKGTRVTEYENDDAFVAGHNSYVDVATTNANEVAVCTTKDKKHGFIVASVKSADLLGRVMETARQLYAEMQGAGGYNHFGCARVRL